MKIPIAWREVNAGDLLKIKASPDDWEVLDFGQMQTFDQDNRPHAEQTIIIRSTRTRKTREIRVERLAV